MKWHYQHNIRRWSWLQLLLAVMACLLVGGGVSFAALISQQTKLTDNMIQTATANLQIGPDGTTYGNTLSGFVFSNLVPGGQAVPLTGYTVYLKNAGGTPLALKLAISSTPVNPDHVDFTKVHVILTPVASGGTTQSFTLQELITAYATGGQAITVPSQLLPGMSQQYKLQVQMDVDSISGSSATISGLDFSFTGIAQS